MSQKLTCPVCQGPSALLDVVDFNKSCEQARGIFFDLSGLPIYYALCGQCGFCFAPSMHEWTPAQFSQQVYNADYAKVDPDYLRERPIANAASLRDALDAHKGQVIHLDYGGGAGLLSQILQDAGWRSQSYDPFVQTEVSIDELPRVNLITAFEVFEHVTDPHQLMRTIDVLLEPDGMVLFSTLLSDGIVAANKRLDWWYAAPRNGHISLHCRASMGRLTSQYGFQWASFSEGFHAMFRQVPAWARHMIQLN